MEYLGGFRLSSKPHGSSDLNYAEGPIGYCPERHTLFTVGHAHHQQIAEWPVPALSPTELPLVNSPLQGFSEVLKRVPHKNNRIGGLYTHNNKLYVSMYNYYDADPTTESSLTHLVVDDLLNLAHSPIAGPYHVEGAGHVVFWISPIPQELQAVLGGTHVVGASSGIPIISRCSVGPSCWVINITDMGPATPLLDYSLTNPLHKDLSNTEGGNDIWTHLSRAVYGFFVDDLYYCVGFSGGHTSGVGYKITQDTGRQTSGFAPYVEADHYPYYWAYNVSDLVLVKKGLVQPWELKPVSYGKFQTKSHTKGINGASYDPASRTLYVACMEADKTQGQYAIVPIIEAYGFPMDPTSGGEPLPDPTPDPLPEPPIEPPVVEEPPIEEPDPFANYSLMEVPPGSILLIPKGD